MNLPTIRSDAPFEYTLAVSIVLIPRSQAALRIGNACSSSRIQGYSWIQEPLPFTTREVFDELTAQFGEP